MDPSTKEVQDFAWRLRSARTTANLSQSKLAKAAGITDRHVRALERRGGSWNPALQTLQRLAEALGVEPAWLAFGSGPRSNP